MANAQVLVLVRSPDLLSQGQIQPIVEAAARAAGFAPGPATFDPQWVTVAPDAGSSLSGTIQSGPWAGLQVTQGGTPSSPRIPSQGLRQALNAYRQNFYNGPSGVPYDGEALIAALSRFGDVKIAYRPPSRAIAWDRGIPAAIDLSTSSAPSPSGGATGWLFGLAAVAGLAFVASRATADGPRTGLSPTSYGRPKFAGLRSWSVYEGNPSWHQARAGHASAASTSGFDTQEEAAWLAQARRNNPKFNSAWGGRTPAKAGLRGLSGTAAEHAAKARSLIAKAARLFDGGFYAAAHTAAVAANAEAQWTSNERLKEESYLEVRRAQRQMGAR